MATFVLVPGLWLGSWAWFAVTQQLRAKGHEVYPLTLTGHADKKHLIDVDINLDTHVLDVFNLIEYEGLSNVVLVGHSYAGLVISGVADRGASKLAKLVYIDTAPLPNGVALLDFYPPDLRNTYRQRVAVEGGGKRLPFPAWEEIDKMGTGKDLDPEMRAVIKARATDAPFGAVKQQVHGINKASREKVPKTAIWCTYPSSQVRQMLEAGNAMFDELTTPGWKFIDLPTGHWPMFSKPKELAEILMNEASA